VLYRDLDNRHGQAGALRNLGDVQRLTGDYPAVTLSLSQALSLYRDLGHRHSEAETLNNLGQLLYATSVPADACAHHVQALGITEALGIPL
jgi:hypothetical protein